MSYQAHKALAGIDLFAGLPNATLSDLIQRGTTFTTGPGRQVVEEGSSDVGLAVVLEGTADVVVNGVPRASLAPGDYFGEISLIDGLPRSATIVSGPDGLTTFRLSALAFAPLMDNPQVSRSLLRALCARLRDVETQSASEGTDS